MDAFVKAQRDIDGDRRVMESVSSDPLGQSRVYGSGVVTMIDGQLIEERLRP